MQKIRTTLRLAISGATGSGKTTLAQDLAHRLRLPMLNENWGPIIRAKESYFSAKNNETSRDDEVHAAFQNWKLSYKTWLDARYQEQTCFDGFVSDRWAADAYSNWLRVFMPRPDDQMSLYFMKTLKKHSEMYDFFVLLPVTRRVAEERNNDGIQRSPSLHIRVMANALTAGLVTHFLERPVIQIPSKPMSREERVDFVLQRTSSLT